MWGEKSGLKKPKNKAYFVNLKQTKKKSTFIDYQIVQVRKIQNLFSFPIAVFILYDVWTGKNRLGQYDKDSSPLKEKDEKKKSFWGKSYWDIFINIYRSRTFLKFLSKWFQFLSS